MKYTLFATIFAFGTAFANDQLLLSDIVSFKSTTKIMNGRFNEIKYEFQLIKIIDEEDLTSGIFKVIRKDSLIKEFKEDPQFSSFVKRRTNYNRRNNRRNLIRRERMRRTKYFINKRIIDEDSKIVSNITKSKNVTIYIEDIDLSNASEGDLIELNNLTLYGIGNFYYPSNGKKFYRKYTLNRDKAKRYLNEKNLKLSYSIKPSLVTKKDY